MYLLVAAFDGRVKRGESGRKKKRMYVGSPFVCVCVCDGMLCRGQKYRSTRISILLDKVTSAATLHMFRGLALAWITSLFIYFFAVSS